jgi:hypothetical protein
LCFRRPPGARVGEAFDLRVAIDARQPIARVAFEITFDPALLKARSLEAIDYAQRTEGERALAIDELSDGRVALVMQIKRGEAIPRNVPLVQFEACRLDGRKSISPTSASPTRASDPCPGPPRAGKARSSSTSAPAGWKREPWRNRG